jgi:hypothetical protein
VVVNSKHESNATYRCQYRVSPDLDIGEDDTKPPQVDCDDPRGAVGSSTLGRAFKPTIRLLLTLNFQSKRPQDE